MKKNLNKLYVKIGIVNAVDLVVIAATLFFLTRLAPIATEVAKLNGQAIAGEQSSEGAVIRADIEREQVKIDKLTSLFLDDAGLVRFNEALASLKSTGVIAETTFVSTTPVVDSTGARGLPLLLKVNGDKAAINTAIREVSNLPALVRPVTVKLTNTDNVMALEYGVFIYIK